MRVGIVLKKRLFLLNAALNTPLCNRLVALRVLLFGDENMVTLLTVLSAFLLMVRAFLPPTIEL